MDIVSKINGNTLSATEFNQIPTELEALQTSSGQTSTDTILNQVSIGTSRYAANNFYIDSGTADAYVLTLAASMTNPVSAVAGQGYFVGMTIRFRAGNAGTGGAAIVNVNGAGVKSLKEADGTTNPLSIPTTQDSEFRYDGTVFRKVNLVVAASQSVEGIIEIATNAEVAAGTDTTRAATAAAIASLFETSLRSTNGYARLPVKVGGAFVEIVAQWGYILAASIPTPGTSYTVSFPIAFPNACLHVNYMGQGTYNAASTANDIVVSKSTANFVLSHGFASPRDVMWFSIGY